MSRPRTPNSAARPHIELSIDEIVLRGLPCQPGLSEARLLAALQEALVGELGRLAVDLGGAAGSHHSQAVASGGTLRYQPGTTEAALGRELARALRSTIERSWSERPAAKERER